MNTTALDDLISEHTHSPQPDPTVTLTVRRLARMVAMPAFTAMFGGLLLMILTINLTANENLSENKLPGPSAISFSNLVQPSAIISGHTPMSLGLLALAALPALTILFILLQHLKARRWIDTIVTATLLAILVFSALVK